MSKVLQERGIEGLSGSIEPNPRDHVKSISTVDSSVIRHIGSGPYVVSNAQYNSLSFKTIPFPNRLHGYCCDNWKEARKVKILETYDHTLPQKEKDSVSFTLPCFIHNICLDKALVDLGASVSVMPFSTHSNLGLGEAINESFDPLYVNYIELNDLDMPLEPRMNQDDFEPTPDFVNEPAYKSFKDTGDHEGKNLAGTLIDIPIFVGKFSIISGFSITDDIDITSCVVPGMPFFKKFVSCQNIMERFTHGDKMQYGVSLGLGYGVLTTCTDLAVKKSTIWYTLKKACVELVQHFDASSTHFCSRTQIGESSPATYQGSSSF
ncbi:hypothetical protein Tco_1369836 [Tanacetum coccineum]